MAERWQVVVAFIEALFFLDILREFVYLFILLVRRR